MCACLMFGTETIGLKFILTPIIYYLTDTSFDDIRRKHISRKEKQKAIMTGKDGERARQTTVFLPN